LWPVAASRQGRGKSRHGKKFIVGWLMKYFGVAITGVSVYRSHFASPTAGATNASGTKIGWSTASACASDSNNLSPDSLKLGRSNTTTPSALAPGARRRALIQCNIVRIITETGLRVYKELMPMKKEQLDLANAMVWIPDSKTPNGVAEVPLTRLALEAFRDQMRLSPCSPYLFPSDQNPSGHLRTLKTTWEATLRRAKVGYFRIYDLRSTYATRLSAGGVADEWVTQMLRQGDAQVFKKYSQMKLQMKREALEKLNRRANEMPVKDLPATETGDQSARFS
jgi:hypothetical protein